MNSSANTFGQLIRKTRAEERTMNRSQTITRASPYKKLVVLLILPSALFLAGAKWVEKPVENLDTIAGEWIGKGVTDTLATCMNQILTLPTGACQRFDVEYVFRKNGAYESRVSVGSNHWSTAMPPGTLQIKEGKLEYRNDKGLVRTGVLYEDKKGRRVLKFRLENGASWKVREKKE
jgi:hypothetical protein